MGVIDKKWYHVESKYKTCIVRGNNNKDSESTKKCEYVFVP